MRYATVESWAKYFKEQEGVQVHGSTIRKRLKKVKAIGVTARNKVGRILKNALYSEADIREILADLLLPCPRVDKNGFIDADGIRYATCNTWSKYYEAKGVKISAGTLSKKLSDANKMSLVGRDGIGKLCNGFFSEGDVYEIYKNLLLECSRVGENGFFEIEGVRYASTRIWSDFFQEEGMYISRQTIYHKLCAANKKGRRGREGRGQIHESAYYAESDVREVCESLLTQVPQANEEEFIVVGNIRYASFRRWARYFKEGEGISISEASVIRRLRRAGKIGITGRGKDRRVHKGTYYSEPDVRSACADLLAKRNPKRS